MVRASAPWLSVGLISPLVLDALFKSELAAVRIKDKEAEKKSYGKFRGGRHLGHCMVVHCRTLYDKTGFMGTKPSTIQVGGAAESSSPALDSGPKIEEIS